MRVGGCASVAGLLLLTACTGGSGAGGHVGQRVQALRRQASVAACPPALTTDLPALTLRCIGDGRPVHVAGAPGRPVLLNFYNTACAPCREEFPVLLRYMRTRPAVTVVGVDAEDSAVDELAFLRDFDAHWPAVSDPDGRLFRKYAGGWPVTVAVRADGTLAGGRAGVHVGRFHSVAEVQALARQAVR
jgi:cytochrome c biogenesis protein CcmG/thiol:disulfide interchange protein DsbE